jgi:hypothetical protein
MIPGTFGLGDGDDIRDSLERKISNVESRIQ